MTYTTYNDGNGIKKNRKVRGSGDTVTPYEAYVVDSDMNTATGTQAQAPADKATLVSNGLSAYSIIQLLKGILINLAPATPALYTEFQTASPVTVSNANTDILEVDCRGKKFLSATIVNSGGTAFNDFFISMRTNTSAGWRQLTFGEVDFTTNVSRGAGNMGYNIIDTSNFGGYGQPFLTMPGSGTGWILMNVRGFSHIKFTAKVASGSTTATIHGNVEA